MPCKEILKRCLFLFPLLIFISFCTSSYSADYGFSWTAFTQGGASRGSENFGLTDSIGSGVVGEPGSENYGAESALYSLVLEQGPTAEIILDPQAPVGLGAVNVTLITSEKVENVPTLEFAPRGRLPITVILSGSDTTFTAQIKIAHLTGDGLAQFSYLATSKETGQPGTVITEGEYFEIATVGTNSLIPLNNLFNPTKGECTTIKFRLEKSTHVRLKIYNLMGDLIKTLIDEERDAGSHEIKWYGKNKDGDEVASGVYILRIEAGGFTEMKKIIVIK